MVNQAGAAAGLDPFMRFWTDYMQKMATAGMPQPQPAPDVMQQMRRAFFEALSEQADQFMRSEAFLSAMKQTMETSLAWQQTLNDAMRKGLSAAQMPNKSDADHLVILLRGMEERILERLADLTARVEKLEQPAEAGPTRGRRK